MDAYGMPYGKGGGGAWAGGAAGYGMKGNPMAAYGGGGGGEDEGGGSSKKKKGMGGWGGEIEGFKEALCEAFQAAGVANEEEDVEDVMKRIVNAAKKQAKKFGEDERASSKMNAAQCKAFIAEVVESTMAAFANSLYEKSWFEKVPWNGVLLMMVLHTFHTGKIFTRVLKPEIIQCIDEGLMAWSEEERVTRVIWGAVDSANIEEKQKKKANQHLMKAYDEAHMLTPFSSSREDVSAEVASIKDFVHAFMKHFAHAGYSVLENGLQDTSKAGQAATLTMMFQQLLSPDSPCVPLSMQPSLPAAPWSFIEECATEVIGQ